MSKGATTKRAILDHAAEVASEVGLRGLTIGSLATRTELSKSGLFAHFRSKEALQLEVLRHARERYVDNVLRPAVAEPRGEPRVRALFERSLAWMRGDILPGGCPFVAASMEFDDQPGTVRDFLVSDQRDLLDSIAQVFRTGIAEDHFRADADPEQFAQDMLGIEMSYMHAHRLLHDPKAEDRAKTAFETLLTAAR